MIKELKYALVEISEDKDFFHGGDFWIPVAVWWIYTYLELFVGIAFNLEKIFSDMISMLSILIGLSITNFIFLIQMIQSWNKGVKYTKIANKIGGWTFLPLVFMLITLFYIIILDILFSVNFIVSRNVIIILKSILIFLFFYSIMQVLCQVLTLWWVFKKRDMLNNNTNTNIENDLPTGAL